MQLPANKLLLQDKIVCLSQWRLYTDMRIDKFYTLFSEVLLLLYKKS